ncbi:MAG: hypothetical protein K8R21_07685 [Leptospira sp.]|nr:hypothetical protein [Leptospira sp.]
MRPNQDFFSYDVGVNKYDGDYYAYIAPAFNFNFGTFGINLGVPLNVLLLDRAPKTPGSKAGQIRKIDYDQKSDYLRFINYAWYGTYGEYKPGETTYSAYVGKIFNGYIGHGTIVNRYINNQRVDVYKVGVMADYNTDYGGVQVFTNSITDKEVSAGRGYIRPFAIGTKAYDWITGATPLFALMPAFGNVQDEAGRKKVTEEAKDKNLRSAEIVEDPLTGEIKEVPKKEEKKDEKKEEEKRKNRGPLFRADAWWNRFAIGYTTAFDANAPNTLSFDTTGNMKLDSKNNPVVINSVRAAIQGYDAEYKLWSSENLEVTPYYDVNTIKNVSNSHGTHYGVLAKIGGKEINLTLKPEYRRMTSNYIPMYFDSYYELERTQSNLNSNLPTPKWQYLKGLDPDGAIVKGYFYTAILNVYNFGFELNYEDYDGKDNSRIFLGAYIPIGQIFRISAYYNKKGFDKRSEALKIDDKSMGAGELAIKLGPFTVKLQDIRRWVLDSATGKYEAKDEQKILFSGGAAF